MPDRAKSAPVQGASHPLEDSPLRVAPPKGPCCVARRSFGITNVSPRALPGALGGATPGSGKRQQTLSEAGVARHPGIPGFLHYAQFD